MLLQREPIDYEFQPDMRGLDYVGFVGGAVVKEPTSRDFEELELQVAVGMDLGDETKVRRPRIPFDFNRCYRLAEAGASAVDVAGILGVEPHIVNNNIRARYNCGWKEYSDRAKAALSGELKAKLIETCRKGNERALLMFAMKFLDWAVPQKIEVTGKDGGPVQNQSVLLITSSEELEEKRRALASVIDRKSRFTELGSMTSTLLLEDGEVTP